MIFVYFGKPIVITQILVAISTHSWFWGINHNSPCHQGLQRGLGVLVALRDLEDPNKRQLSQPTSSLIVTILVNNCFQMHRADLYICNTTHSWARSPWGSFNQHALWKKKKIRIQYNKCCQEKFGRNSAAVWPILYKESWKQYKCSSEVERY